MILIQIDDNLGFTGSNNVEIQYKVSKGDGGYIWILDNNTVIDKKALVEMIKLAETNKKIGIVGSKIMNYYSPKVIDAIGGGNFIPRMGIAREIGSGELDNGQ
jgi:GT2 family glycosyltransferase